jgi:hypothetical protein
MRALRILSVLLLFSVVAFAADSPLSGTWKLSLEKSKLAASDLTKSDVYHIKADEKNISLQEEQTDDKGLHRFSVDAKYDGKEYPIKADPPDPTPSTGAYKRVGSHQFTATLKQAGKVIATATTTLSEDGQTSTVKYTNYLESGKTETGTAVYDKQPD